MHAYEKREEQVPRSSEKQERCGSSLGKAAFLSNRLKASDSLLKGEQVKHKHWRDGHDRKENGALPGSSQTTENPSASNMKRAIRQKKCAVDIGSCCQPLHG